MTDSLWCTPQESVDRFARGEMKLLPPTVHTLRRLIGFADAESALAELRSAPVAAILPRMRRDPAGVAIELPPEADV